jgi:hypothetical protein
VTTVADDRAVFHTRKMFIIDYVTITRDSDKDVAYRSRLGNRHNTKTVHHRFDCLDRIDFRDDHVCAHATRTERNAFSAPAVTNHDEVASGEQDVGRADDTVKRRLSGAVTVIEEVLGLRVVDGDGREGQHTRFLHRLETLNAGCRFFGRTDNLRDLIAAFFQQRCDDVGTVVDDDVRVRIKRGTDVTIVGVG